jgi:hypothetical protein
MLTAYALSFVELADLSSNFNSTIHNYNQTLGVLTPTFWRNELWD